jgi:hypothetical protein
MNIGVKTAGPLWVNITLLVAFLLTILNFSLFFLLAYLIPYPEITNTFSELGCRKGPISIPRWRTLIHNHPDYELGSFRNLTHMFDDIFILQYWEQTFFEYTYSATYKCPNLHCPYYNTEIIGENLTTISIRFPSAEGVIDLNQNLANETNNICAQGRYHCERCESRIRTENISTINSVQLPCMIVVEATIEFP